jgi:hypothetical protein
MNGLDAAAKITVMYTLKLGEVKTTIYPKLDLKLKLLNGKIYKLLRGISEAETEVCIFKKFNSIY